jgi:D-psicose/D-tagatose/L-ribulose 3-epimerase
MHSHTVALSSCSKVFRARRYDRISKRIEEETGVMRVKIGMNLLLWTDTVDPEKHNELFRSIQKWGFNGVEIPADLQPNVAEQLAEQLDILSLERTTILALDAATADPTSSDSVIRGRAIESMKHAIRNTHQLGAKLMCGPLFQGLGKFTGKPPQEEEWSYAVESIREAGIYAQEYGVRIALEPLNRFEMYLVNTVEDGVRFVKDVGLDNVGLLVDTHHGNIEENDVAVAWRKAGQHIFHVHISENHRGVPGSGHAVPLAIFQTLKEIGYQDWLTIEAFSQNVPSLAPRLHLWRNFSGSIDDAARLGISYIQQSLSNCEEVSGQCRT